MIISIANQKGGVGKTTTAINLAAAFQDAGKQALLIDIDPQANATTGVGLPPATERSIFHVLEGSVPISEAIRETEFGLKVIPSHIHLAKRVNELEARSYREELLRTALSPIAREFDFVVVDSPPALNVLSQNAIGTSDWLIIPCKMDRYSLDGLGDLFDTIHEVNRGQPTTRYKILLTMYDSRTTRTNTAIEQDICDYIEKGQVYKTRIRRNEALNQAHLVGQPVFSFDPSSNGAEDYRALTQEILREEV